MRTPITYYGGKQKLASTIISMMPSHHIYCEPYFGGGAVFFAKPKSPVEVINDHDERLMTFYRQVVYNFDELQKMIKNTLCSESEWLRARRIFFGHGKKKSELEIAWAVFVLCNLSYSSSPSCGWKWDNNSDAAKMFNAKRIQFTKNLQNRLSTVQISNRDAIAVIEQRDTADTFFYLDPPYLNANQQHYSGFSKDDLTVLLTTLSMLNGKFILSHFMNSQLYQAINTYNWKYKVIDAPLTVANHCRATNRRKQEILVYNYTNEPTLFDNIENNQTL